MHTVNLCGNSGVSPPPHTHIHGSATDIYHRPIQAIPHIIIYDFPDSNPKSESFRGHGAHFLRVDGSTGPMTKNKYNIVEIIGDD